MPDGTGGVATGLYWVITGKLPAEDLEDQKDDPKEEPDEDPLTQKDKKGR
jgi:hypothetical protein